METQFNPNLIILQKYESIQTLRHAKHEDLSKLTGGGLTTVLLVALATECLFRKKTRTGRRKGLTVFVPARLGLLEHIYGKQFSFFDYLTKVECNLSNIEKVPSGNREIDYDVIGCSIYITWSGNQCEYIGIILCTFCADRIDFRATT